MQKTSAYILPMPNKVVFPFQTIKIRLTESFEYNRKNRFFSFFLEFPPFSPFFSIFPTKLQRNSTTTSWVWSRTSRTPTPSPTP